MGDELNKIAVFQQKEVRKTFHHGEWWFVIVDVVAVLTDSVDPVQYLRNLRNRDEELAKFFVKAENKGRGQNVPSLSHENAEGVSQFETPPRNKGGVQFEPPLPLPFDTAGGKQKLLCWHTEGIFRLIQSIPSKKAEPFKRWLARTGYERVQEIEDPELAQKRMKATYRAKGYDDAWIERRVRGIAIRNELTDEWDKRGVNDQRGYAVLTSEISKATFGITPSEYKKLKGLERENLRDHMNDLELLFTQLGEAATTEIARTNDAQGMPENKDAAQRGGSVAGTARKQLEAETGREVVSKQAYLPRNESSIDESL